MKNFYLIIFVTVLLINSSSTLSAQSLEPVTQFGSDLWTGCELGVHEFRGRVYVPLRESVKQKMENRQMPCSNFIVTYNGFESNTDARDAFQFAVDIWANLLDSPVPIRVDATFAPISSLGSAGPDGYLAVSGDGLTPSTVYARALGESILGMDSDGPTGSSNDLSATFSSSSSSFYFGTDGNTPNDKIDFVSVVLHELGHGLGVLGFGRQDTSVDPDVGRIRNGGVVHIWDQFIDGINIFGNPNDILDNFSDPSSQLLDQFTNDQLTTDGPIATAQNGGNQPGIQSPDPFRPGSSYSHISEAEFNNTPNALMTPFIGNGETLHDPGNVLLGFMEDMGWTLCQGTLNTNSFSNIQFKLSPNPFTNKITIELDTSVAVEDYRVSILDITGKIILQMNPTVRNGKIIINQLEQLGSSIYFLRISSNSSGASVTKKIIRQ